MKKKITALALVICLLAVAVVGGTMAYFTDTDEATNVFTMGNVSIQQFEHQRVDGGLVELDPNQTLKLMPIIEKNPTGVGYPTADSQWLIGGYYPNLDISDGTALNARYVWLWDEANAVDKIVSVTNDGDNGVYVRTIVAVPTELAEHLALCYNGPGPTWLDHSSVEPVVSADIDGISYDLFVFTYIRADGILEPNESTGPSLMQVCMLSTTENDDIPTNYKSEFNILVASQAVQADGFAETFPDATYVAVEALDTAFGDITSTNHPWATT